jgi:hypothetical protein
MSLCDDNYGGPKPAQCQEPVPGQSSGSSDQNDNYECVGNPGAIEIRIPLADGGTAPACLNSPMRQLERVRKSRVVGQQTSVIEIVGGICIVRLNDSSQNSEEEGSSVQGPPTIAGPSTPVRDILRRIASGAREQLVRVGRWMGDMEYQQMIQTGRAQESYTGTTHVAYPNNPSAFYRQATSGQQYVEFDVPASYVRITEEGEGWAKIIGPNSLEGRAARKLGLPVPSMPEVYNVLSIMTKP